MWNVTQVAGLKPWSLWMCATYRKMICQCISNTPHPYYRGVGKCEISSLNFVLNSRFTRQLPTRHPHLGIWQKYSIPQVKMSSLTSHSNLQSPNLPVAQIILSSFVFIHIPPLAQSKSSWPHCESSPSHCHHSVPGHLPPSSGLSHGLLEVSPRSLLSVQSSPSWQPGWHCWNLESTQNPQGLLISLTLKASLFLGSCQAHSHLRAPHLLFPPGRFFWSLQDYLLHLLQVLLKIHFIISFSILPSHTL